MPPSRFPPSPTSDDSSDEAGARLGQTRFFDYLAGLAGMDVRGLGNHLSTKLWENLRCAELQDDASALVVARSCDPAAIATNSARNGGEVIKYR